MSNDSESSSSAPPPNPEGSEGTFLPSGARIEDSAGTEEAAPKKGISRRGLLTGIGIGAAVVAAGGVGTWVFASNRKPKTANGLSVTKSWAGKTIAVTAPSGACDAPLIVAYEKGFFKQAGLNVVLKKTATDEDVPAAVGSGKYTASNGIFFNYLGPIYNGTPVKLSGGLHHGCLDLYVRNDGSVPTISDLKGKKIGTGTLQGSAMNYFSLELLDVGINSAPAAKQVEWVVIDQSQLPQALKTGRVDAIATSGGYAPIIQAVKDGWAKEISNNDDNMATKMSDNAKYPCCAVVLNETFVSEDPVTASKLVNAWSQGSRWAGTNLEETAKLEASGSYVDGTPEEILQVLQTMTFDPSPKNLQETLLPGIEKFIKTGFLPSDTNAKILANKAFVDLGLNF